MRTLKFNKPYRIYRTDICNGKSLEAPDNAHYSRFSTITTKYGLVTASELSWGHNLGRMYCTLFSTAIEGLNYSAWLEQAQLSDRQLKWMATNFIKRIINPQTFNHGK